MGRNKTDTPDAFVVFDERYARAEYPTDKTERGPCLASDGDSKGFCAKVREYRRWLTEISEQGVFGSLKLKIFIKDAEVTATLSSVERERLNRRNRFISRWLIIRLGWRCGRL